MNSTILISSIITIIIKIIIIIIFSLIVLYYRLSAFTESVWAENRYRQLADIRRTAVS